MEYTFKVGIIQNYDVNIVADNYETAQHVADNIDPKEDDRAHFSHLDRNVELEGSRSIIEMMNAVTPYFWETIASSGNTSSIRADLTKDWYAFIIKADGSDQAPTNTSEEIFLVFASKDTNHNETHHRFYYGMVELLEDDELAKTIFDFINLHENTCSTCGETLAQCKENRLQRVKIQETFARLEDAFRFDHVTTNHLTIVLDGYLNHALPECNTKGIN